MSLTIHLPPETEKKIRSEAKKRGIPAEQFAGEIVQRNLPPDSQPGSLWGKLTPEECIERPRQWSESHKDWPVLPPGADSRESIYEERIDALLSRHQHPPQMVSDDRS